MHEDEIQQKRRDNEELATQSRARILNLEYLDTRPFENDRPLVHDILSPEQMRRDFIIPLSVSDGESPFEFMVTSQTPKSALEQLRTDYANKGERIVFYLISLSAFKVFMLRHDPPREPHYDDIKIAQAGDSATITSVSQTLNSVASDRVLDFLIEQADKLGASDIHIENLREQIRIRLRVDGILHPVANLEKDRYRVLIGELSSRAGLSTAATQPQSGHIQKEIFHNGASHLLNLRVEMIPTMYGQDSVLRLFNFDESLLQLDLLGISTTERAVLDDVISHPHGLLLMVGPTGSGKSTTLYSIINALNTTNRKIITLEDPIEYGINGISQIPVDTTKGDSFADHLRSVLRLDPDVVMVGEIRDADTARTAIQASITGHLVLSSFHANSTANAFARMIDMIGTNPIFSSSIRLVIAQRLVRKLADNKEFYQPDDTTRRYVQSVLKNLSPDVLAAHQITDLENFQLARPVVSDDAPFGYNGRIAIMEQMTVNEEISAFLRGDVKDVNTTEIERVAKNNGLITLEQKGVIAALHGDTTLDEISRVV